MQPPSISKRLEELRLNPGTCMSGARWTGEEDERLKKHIAEGMSLEEIAVDHRRTLGGVQARLADWAVQCVLHEGCGYEEAASRFRVSEDAVRKKHKKWTVLTTVPAPKKRTEENRSIPLERTPTPTPTPTTTTTALARIEEKLDAILSYVMRGQEEKASAVAEPVVGGEATYSRQ